MSIQTDLIRKSIRTERGRKKKNEEEEHPFFFLVEKAGWMDTKWEKWG
jgi:hypothetical protein